MLELDKEILQGVWCTRKELLDSYAIPTALKVYKEALLAWMREED